MTTAQLVETSVTANNNGPIQYYAQLGDHAQGTYKFILFDMKLCFCHSQAIFSISIKIVANKDAQQALLTEWTLWQPCRHSPFNWTPDVRAGFINKLKSLLCNFILVRAYKSRKA